MLKNKKKNIAIVAAMAMVLVVGAISAYFTSSDDATNVWTVGEVKIDLTEPEWDEENPPKDITPNEEFKKDPQITNIGVNDAYVFLKVRVPMANVATSDVATGARIEAANQELFKYTINSDEWVEVGTPYLETFEGVQYTTHIYAYAKNGECTPLAVDVTTAKALFDKVTFINAIEGQGLENTTIKMPIEAYGIQTTDLTASDVKDPASVWSILNVQTVGEGGAVAPYNDGVK